MKNTYRYNPKEKFVQRMNELLPDKEDQEIYWEIVHKRPVNSIRCNTLKIDPEDLIKDLKQNNGWDITQPYASNPEIMIIETPLAPGEIGKSKEHLLGYYYVQEISSMMPIIALKPKHDDILLDCCASPGSKTTQAAAAMENQGIIIANDNNIGRLMILASNLEKNAVANTTLTRKDGAQLSKELRKEYMTFTKILADVPCSGEGTLRSSPQTFLMWNPKMIEKFARIQKKIALPLLENLKEGQEMIYSTCTHAPEENEEVIQYLLDNYEIELLPVEIPLKTRPGLSEWNGKKFDPQIKMCARIYPQDNNTEGFFITKIKKIGGKKEKPLEQIK